MLEERHMNTSPPVTGRIYVWGRGRDLWLAKKKYLGDRQDVAQGALKYKDYSSYYLKTKIRIGIAMVKVVARIMTPADHGMEVVRTLSIASVISPMRPYHGFMAKNGYYLEILVAWLETRLRKLRPLFGY